MAKGDRSRHLGLDLGATNIKWAAVEGVDDEWVIIDRGQQPTDAHEGAGAVIDRMAAVAAEVSGRVGDVAAVGLGVPGLYDASGATTFLPNLPADWTDRPVAKPLSARLGCPVRLINDARAFGLAELRLGAGRGSKTMVGITLGSGVGGVIAIGGSIHSGQRGTAGEVGHQTLAPEGPACTCGNRGCLEALANADAVALACGTESAEAAVAAAKRGDQRAIDGLAEVGRWLGIGIANLIVVLTPDRVVLGGGVAGAGDLLLEPVRSEVVRRVHVTSLGDVEILIGVLGIWAGAVGAAVNAAE